MTIHPTDQLESLVRSRQTARDLTLRGVNLCGIKLVGLRADGLDLEGSDLRESSLTEVKWKGCVLRDARLDAANFTDAVLRLCDFDRAWATNAIFRRSRLENSTARAAQFDRADFTDAVLTDTDFSRASLCSANLEGVSASGASFRGADLRDANLRNADLADADLRGADLTDANLEGANLDGAALEGAIGVAAVPQEPGMETIPEELKPLIGTIAPLVDEMLRSAVQSGLLDAEAMDQLQQQMADMQQTHPRRSLHPDTLKAVSQVIDSLDEETLSTLFASLKQSDNADPPPVVQALIQCLGQSFALDDNASPEEVLAKLAIVEPTFRTSNSNIEYFNKAIGSPEVTSRELSQ